VELACLEFAEPASWGPADAALERLHTYDGVLFTSPRAVAEMLGRLGSWPPFEGVVAAVGGATGAALEARGVTPDVVPERFHSEALVEALVSRGGLDGTRWLLPRAEVARAVIPDGLAAAGATVDIVAVYRTVPPADPEPLRATLAAGLDAITFASGSSVRNLRGAVGEAGWPGALRGVVVATIGPVTTAAALQEGLTVQREATTASLPGLVAAVADGVRGRP